MEPLEDTFTVRTRDGREFSGFTLSSLQIAAAQKIFSLEDAVRPDRVAGTWTPLARMLTLPEPPLAPPVPSPHPPTAPVPAPTPDPRVSTGIALDLDAHPRLPRPAITPPVRAAELPTRPAPDTFIQDEDEGPVRHRLRIAGAFLLFAGFLGMVGYAYGKHGVPDILAMLINTGLGIALLMNLPQIRKWAVGWVVAGWALAWGAGTLAGGCFGFVIVGLIAGLIYGGPVCLLWGEECPKSRFWTGIVLMGILVLLAVLGVILVAAAGVALFQRLQG
ncbi:MAG: hypothetical protein IPN59_00840 [Holophaga sp.]|nr:hypothetical protein [Holophaga sp.]